jgi:hypothetical protein
MQRRALDNADPLEEAAERHSRVSAALEGIERSSPSRRVCREAPTSCSPTPSGKSPR